MRAAELRPAFDWLPLTDETGMPRLRLDGDTLPLPPGLWTPTRPNDFGLIEPG